MRIRKGTFLYRFLRSFSWSENIKKPKRYVMPETFSERLLAGLSFSFDTKKEVLVRRKIDPTIALKFGRLWDEAHRNERRGKLSAAEKALRKILEMDSGNVAAYNRIGIIKAKQKKFDESISMFRQAVKIEKSASTTHNLALVYYEVGSYEKSEQLFRKSIRLDRSLAVRHIVLAKVLEKQGKETQMFEELIKAVELEPSRDTFKLLEVTYRSRGMLKEADLVKEEVDREVNNKNKAPLKTSYTQYKISERSDKISQLIFSYE